MNKCQWALNAFNEWKSARNTSAAETNSDISPIRLELVEISKDDLCYSLMQFVLEARKQSGEDYPAESLYEMVICLQIYLSSKGKEYKFLDDDAFIPLKNTLDSKMKELSSAGKRVQWRKAEIITYEEEQLMCEKGA